MRFGSTQPSELGFLVAFMQLPKRPAPYIVMLLIAVMATLTLWMFRVVTAPELRKVATKRQGPPQLPAPPAGENTANSGQR